jgi:hypothetical protein
MAGALDAGQQPIPRTALSLMTCALLNGLAQYKFLSRLTTFSIGPAWPAVYGSWWQRSDLGRAQRHPCFGASTSYQKITRPITSLPRDGGIAADVARAIEVRRLSEGYAVETRL